MFGLSASHMIVLGIVVLLFGSRRLPELGSSLGKAMRAFKSATEGNFVEDETNSNKTQIAQSQTTKPQLGQIDDKVKV